MTNLRHYDNWGTVRFVTFSCYLRLPSLNEPGAKEILIDELDRARTKHQFQLLGYVLMPEHVHLVLIPPDGMKLGLVIREIKSRSAKRYFAESRVAPSGMTRVFWQLRCYDHNCRTVETVREKVHYCHKNPVRRGLVNDPGDWEWSSYNWYKGKKDVPIRMDEVSFG
ncbi:MAG: transposase [Candidatus Zixiibacteriota bacterium]